MLTSHARSRAWSLRDFGVTLCVGLALACARGPVHSSPPAGAELELRAELEQLGRSDQADREGFGAAVAAHDTMFFKRLLAGDSARTARLRQIVHTRGWPRAAVVGPEAANAAWLIVQHSPSVEFQREILPHMEAAAHADELRMSEVALLVDRVRVRLGQPQRYGSQFSILDGRMVADPIEDLAHLDERRAAVGLPPMAEYVEQLRRVYNLPVEWPPRR